MIFCDNTITHVRDSYTVHYYPGLLQGEEDYGAMALQLALYFMKRRNRSDSATLFFELLVKKVTIFRRDPSFKR